MNAFCILYMVSYFENWEIMKVPRIHGYIVKDSKLMKTIRNKNVSSLVTYTPIKAEAFDLTNWIKKIIVMHRIRFEISFSVNLSVHSIPTQYEPNEVLLTLKIHSSAYIIIMINLIWSWKSITHIENVSQTHNDMCATFSLFLSGAKISEVVHVYTCNSPTFHLCTR